MKGQYALLFLCMKLPWLADVLSKDCVVTLECILFREWESGVRGSRESGSCAARCESTQSCTTQTQQARHGLKEEDETFSPLRTPTKYTQGGRGCKLLMPSLWNKGEKKAILYSVAFLSCFFFFLIQYPHVRSDSVVMYCTGWFWLFVCLLFVCLFVWSLVYCRPDIQHRHCSLKGISLLRHRPSCLQSGSLNGSA